MSGRENKVEAVFSGGIVGIFTEGNAPRMKFWQTLTRFLDRTAAH